MSPPNHSSSRSRGPAQGYLSAGRSKSTTANTTVTQSSRPKDANYQQKLIDGGVYPYGYKFPDGSRPRLPNEWDELNQRLAQPRPSLSPSTFPEDKYERFVEEDASASNKDAVENTVIPAMLNAMGASDTAHKNVWYNNMLPLVPGISQPKPDYYYGTQPELIDQQVREDLSQHIVPSTSTHLPAVPNFSMEAKGPFGTNAEALLRACNAGAVGARAMHSLQNYQQDEPLYDGRVSSISSIYNGGVLKLYGHSVSQSNGLGAQPLYQMHQLKGFAMTNSVETFLQGATAFKNANDLTEEYRNAAIAHANGRSAASTVEADEDTHNDEVGVDADSSQTLQSSAYSTMGGEDDAEESATSKEHYPPAKRPSRRSSGSGRRKAQPSPVADKAK